MYNFLSDRSLYAVIMHNSMYLNLEGYFSLRINLKFCEVKFKPFGHPFLYGGFLLPLIIIHFLTVSWRLRCDLFTVTSDKTLKIDTENNLFKVKSMQRKTCLLKIISKSV